MKWVNPVALKGYLHFYEFFNGFELNLSNLVDLVESQVEFEFAKTLIEACILTDILFINLNASKRTNNSYLKHTIESHTQYPNATHTAQSFPLRNKNAINP